MLKLSVDGLREIAAIYLIPAPRWRGGVGKRTERTSDWRSTRTKLFRVVRMRAMGVGEGDEGNPLIGHRIESKAVGAECWSWKDVVVWQLAGGCEREVLVVLCSSPLSIEKRIRDEPWRDQIDVPRYLYQKITHARRMRWWTTSGRWWAWLHRPPFHPLLHQPPFDWK